MINTTINTTGLFPKQIKHAQTLVDSLYLNGFAFDPSETGCGKTYTACAVARQLNVPVLVISPKPVVPTWERTMKIFGIKPIAIKNYESLIRGNNKSRFTSWKKEKTGRINAKGNPLFEEKLRFNRRLPKNSLIIFDEVHKCKALDSTTSELLISAAQQGFKILKLSASAATNPIEMKAFGYATRLHRITDHNEFKRGWCKDMGAEWRQGRVGGMVFDPESPKSKAAMLSIHTHLFEKTQCASRLTKTDMAEYFGDNQIIADAFDMGNNTDKINRVYDMMEAELAKLEDRAASYSHHIFAIMMKARRHAELLKVPTYVEETVDHIREGRSVALFLNFNESIDAAIKLLKKKFDSKVAKTEYGDFEIVAVRGGQSDKAREYAIDSFQSDKARIIVCNIAAGGVGISLHDLNGKHSRVSLISPNYSAVQLIQSLGRIHRAGAKSGAYQKIIFAANTIEEQACKRVQARLDNLSLLNDGDMTRGIKFYGYVDFDQPMK